MKRLLNQLWKFHFTLIFSVYTMVVSAQALLDPLTQPKFVNPLPVPGVIDARSGGLFSIDITQFQQNLGLVDPITGMPLLTTVWGYNGTYPGPTILARQNVPVEVFWNNKLVDAGNKPLPHLLPVDVSIDWALAGTSNWQQDGVPVVTHLHGGHTESASDGLPDAWYTPNFTKKGPGFIKGDLQPYSYSNSQEAATLFYHDHALGVTRLNVYAGLAGFYLITDENETNLVTTGQLPAAPYDLGLAIQDKTFTSIGALYYASRPPVTGAPDPSIIAESFGNVILVNGMAWPVLDVEPRQYRFRIVNGSDSRFYGLSFSKIQSFAQIASDDGLLSTPVTLTDLLIAPGERKEIIVDFSNPKLLGQTVILENKAKVPFPRGSTVDPKTTGQVMAFRVVKPINMAYPLTPVPQILQPAISRLTTTLPPRQLILFESSDNFGRLKPMLGTFNDGILPFYSPVTENPALNSTEIWEIYNETVDAHPIHLHQVKMQLVNRQKFSAKIDPLTGKPANVKLIGKASPPGEDEAGWKDTYIMFPGEVTRVIAKFDLPGRYVWHCHILSHEDYEMMRPFFVGDNSAANSTNSIANLNLDLESKFKVNAFPNPFNNNLALELTLDRASMVTMNIYDMKGTLIQRLSQGQRAIGLHRFAIDGNRLANGTYLCEILVNGDRIVRKLVLQK